MSHHAPAHVLVAGAGYAGIIAAQRLARRAGDRVRVTLVNPLPHLVERIRLHQVAAGWTSRERRLADLLRGTGAALRLGRVVAIDPARRRVELDEGGARTWVAVDHLVLAAGSTTRGELRGGGRAHRLDTPASARALGRAAREVAGRGQRLVVVGGGLTAIEAVSELVDATPGLRAALVCRGRVGEGALGPAAAAHVRAALVGRGVELLEETPALAVEPGAVVTAAGLVHGGAVLWTAGFAASPLAAAAGLAVDGAGRMLVDDTRVVADAPWIWGAGDAAVPAVPVGAPVVMACKIAMPMGAHVADNVARVVRGRAPAPFSFGDVLVCASLGRGDGVVQRRDRAGGNRGALRGRPAAWIKEAICRGTVTTLAATRRWAGFLRWLDGPRPTLPAATPARLDAGGLP